MSDNQADIEGLARALCASGHSLSRGAGLPCAEPMPSTERVIELTALLRQVLFPGYFGGTELRPATLVEHVAETLAEIHEGFRLQIYRGLVFNKERADCSGELDRAARLTQHFVSQLPAVQSLLAMDVEAAFAGDPAAQSTDEAIFCYPGLLAVTAYRLAHVLHELDVPLLPRMISEHAHSVTGIDIHPAAQIGERFFIDHGTGVVVGETCVIGDRVRLYQGVTLGAKRFPSDAAGNPIKGVERHPIIDDDVVIYSGATVLGRIRIGRGSVIGGNVWLTEDVPANSRISLRPPQQEGQPG